MPGVSGEDQAESVSLQVDARQAEAPLLWHGEPIARKEGRAGARPSIGAAAAEGYSYLSASATGTLAAPRLGHQVSSREKT
jgi:hypothetical protein